ncbi:Variant surface glycoprotein [Trypanosoma congolense IL3000]|uniref:Variant surface glycoprotein n=1 Tax=Trypanosoma congolense (strain IL3000) TaxID=1068625 RepID=F9WAU3_TRYCI|nr:Variant surface glycoprotein [Trypanosoma congolense IL3000]
MARFVKGIAVVIFSLLGVASGQVEVARDDNIEPFSLLCRIYNVAKNPPINYVDLQEADKIVEEIDELNRSLLEEKRHDEEEDVGNNSETQVKTTVTREAALAQLTLNQITQKAHKILDDIKKMNVTKEIGKAKAEFDKVIFGDGGNESELCQDTVNGMDNRSEVCGKLVMGQKEMVLERTLLWISFCLCAQRTVNSEGINQVCGFYVGRIDNYYGWSEQGPWGSSTMWASIKGGCGKYMQQHPKSTGEARHILDQFLKHLETGGVYRWGDSGDKVDGSERKAGMLGTGAGKKDGSGSGNSLVCNGKKGGKLPSSPGGICVYYGPESDHWNNNIPWVKQFQTALTTLNLANNQTATIQRSFKKLQMLQHRAEQIYETAKVMLKVQNPVGLPAAFQNASGNLTAFNTTRTRSYTCRTHTYFTILWVLFLL